jgi:hypothetical protein
MGIILFWLFKLKVGNCVNSMVNIYPMSYEEKREICTEYVNAQEQLYNFKTNVGITQ